MEEKKFLNPSFDNQRPCQQVPFQFSLHVDNEGAKIEHHSYLERQGQDPREEYVRKLVEVTKGCNSIIVYNKAFECRILRELSELFPHYKRQIESVIDRVVDLMIPFRDKAYYSKEMNGSDSIKVVLPALVP